MKRCLPLEFRCKLNDFWHFLPLCNTTYNQIENMLITINTKLDHVMNLFDDRYGQMTAGSYCYIGPQGIVHGTTVSAVL